METGGSRRFDRSAAVAALVGGVVAAGIVGAAGALFLPGLLTVGDKAVLSREAQASRMDLTLLEINAEAQAFMRENGFWPCDLSDLDMPGLAGKAAARGWKIQIDCDWAYAAIFFTEGGARRFRAISFETEDIQEGTDG